MAEHTAARILVVDDDTNIINVVTEALAKEPYEVVCVNDPIEALRHLRSNPVDLVLTDLVMGQHSGVQILEAARSSHPDAIVMLMTAHPTVQTAITVLKQGAYDFLVKPFKLDHLRATIRRGLAHQKVLRENLTLKSQVEFLSAANCVSTGIDIDNYLLRVIKSCRAELSASAAAVIEMHPATRQILRRVYSFEDESLGSAVLDTTTLYELADTRSEEPLVRSTSETRGSGEVIRLSIGMPIIVNQSLHGVINMVAVSRFGQITPGQMDILRILAGSAGAAIINHRLYQDLQSSYMEAIRALTSAIEARDKCTRGHTDRVLILARELAIELGWRGQELEDLTMGCTLHDIGKIAIPDAILNKEGALNAEERERMFRHPLDGLKIIANIDRLKPAIPYILAHHEKWDGTGYPRGLRGEDIPIEGRLLAVADTFDAMLSDRPYRQGGSIVHAVREIKRCRGTQFDPEIVDAFLDLLRRGKVNLQGLYGSHRDFSELDAVLTTEKASV
ncbi:MAG: response regulator [candidate division Zixibacteria bacterium]|nr:response regulator [candidate division Zixibacteria bacterium]